MLDFTAQPAAGFGCILVDSSQVYTLIRTRITVQKKITKKIKKKIEVRSVLITAGQFRFNYWTQTRRSRPWQNRRVLDADMKASMLPIGLRCSGWMIQLQKPELPDQNNRQTVILFGSGDFSSKEGADRPTLTILFYISKTFKKHEV